MPDIPLRELLATFSRAVSATLAVGPGLDAFVHEANGALGATRTSVWLHDRRARALALTATSHADPSAPIRTSTDDRDSPAGRGLRLEHPQLFRETGGTIMLAPLRGWRRALGTIVVENPTFTDEARLLILVDELARQLSVGVENVLLLEQVLSQRQQLAQAEKLASLGRFVAGIAHEMNNPLQGVLGHLELLIRTSVEARPIRKQLRGIYQEADRAAKIVQNLLVFSGSHGLKRKRVRLDRIVTRALASRRAAHRKRAIEIVREDSPELPSVSGDPLLLHQALLNILINAEHAVMASEGSRRIQVSVRGDRKRGLVVATIRDSGPGIPPEALPRIFEPFFTTKEVGHGTGLGLAITYGIVQEHGGQIRAANHPEGGAMFTIELPEDLELPDARVRV